MADDTVNDQIVNPVADVVSSTTGVAPATAFAMLDAVMVETLGMAMYNAVNRQQGAGMTASAAVNSACAKMLSAPFPIKSPPAPPPAPPPTVDVLPPVPMPPATNAEQLATAGAQAQEAIQMLLQQSANGSTLSEQATALLAKIAPPVAANPKPVEATSGDTAQDGNAAGKSTSATTA